MASASIISCQANKETPGGEAPAATAATPAADMPAPAEETPATIDVSRTKTFIGQPLADAEAACKAAGIRCRVVEVDGEPRIVTKDFIADRLNFRVVGGRITAVTKG